MVAKPSCPITPREVGCDRPRQLQAPQLAVPENNNTEGKYMHNIEKVSNNSIKKFRCLKYQLVLKILLLLYISTIYIYPPFDTWSNASSSGSSFFLLQGSPSARASFLVISHNTSKLSWVPAKLGGCPDHWYYQMSTRPGVAQRLFQIFTYTIYRWVLVILDG